MSLLGSIRKRLSIFGTIIVVAILVGFLSNGIIGVFSVFSNFYSGRVLVVCNKSVGKNKYILYRDFFKRKYAHSEPSDQDIKKAIFDKIVFDEIFSYELNKLGVNLSREEIIEIVQGDHVSSFIKDMEFFQDSLGDFDKSKLINYLKNIHEKSPKEQSMWMNIERSIVESRKIKKIENIFSYACNTSVCEKVIFADNFGEERVVDYFFIPNEEIKTLYKEGVSDEELKEYYKKNEETFWEEDVYCFKFFKISYEVSESDISDFFSNIEELSTEFLKTGEVEPFARANSDSEESVSIYLFENDLDNILRSGYTKIENVIKPERLEKISIGEKFYVYKVLEKNKDNSYTVIRITKIFTPTYEMKNDLERNLVALGKKNDLKSFYKISKELNIPVEEIFVKESELNLVSKNIGFDFSNVLDYAKKTSSQKILDPIYIENCGYFLIRYMKKKKSRLKNFEEVKDFISFKISQIKLKNRLLSSPDSSLEEIFKNMGSGYKLRSKSLRFNKFDTDSNEFLGSVFGAKKGRVYGCISDSGIFIFVVTRINKVSDKKINEPLNNLGNFNSALIELANVRYK